MNENFADRTACEIMLRFADSTGISSTGKAPRRYLWTDAYAVCNLLNLYKETGDETWHRLALRLVDQVHHTLGWHRQDDFRTGWISGLDAAEGENHPTIGGLRIGKKLSERKRGEPYNERLEWERDGQYFHYLTKWMHALNRVGQVTGDPAYVRWGIELARTAFARFSYIHPGSGRKRMYWKMSIDLHYPLVLEMGQHDPLDALVTYSELRAAANGAFKNSALPGLDAEIAELLEICNEEDWSTNDPLGIGGLLCSLVQIAQLMLRNSFTHQEILAKVIDAATTGMQSFTAENPLKYRARQRLPFRELGLAIGLKGICRLREQVGGHWGRFLTCEPMAGKLDVISGYLPLARIIERFWLDEKNREDGNWVEHSDINEVMLATALAPEGFLSV